MIGNLLFDLQEERTTLTLGVWERLCQRLRTEFGISRAARGCLADFGKVLWLVPDVEPELEEDRVTDGND